jgi:hypothetical protein
MVRFIRLSAVVVGASSSLYHKYISALKIALYTWPVRPKRILYLNICNTLKKKHQPQLYVHG